MNQIPLFEGRVLSWFSCGAASAVAAKLSRQKYGERCIPIYCDSSADEHEDNRRFMAEVEEWIGAKVTIIRSDKYRTPDEVFAGESYMAGPRGARCTTELKKIPRLRFATPDDIHIFGFTSNEKKRIRLFEQRNPDMRLEWILRDNGITKDACYKMLMSAGIALPKMYLLGYRNNNCKGCVKSTSPGYWNKIREDFPDVFKTRAVRSRALGVRLIELRGKRIFLDELPAGVGAYKPENISCGPECG